MKISSVIKLVVSGVLPITVCAANNKPWQDFENNVYIGGAYSINSPSINQFGSSSSTSPNFDLGATALFDNAIYINLEGNVNFDAGGTFIGNWYNATLKFGYSINSNAFNIIPYIMLGYGNEGAYYSNTTNVNYGPGLLSELNISSNWLLYIDLNYQWQNYGAQLDSDFNQNVLNNYSLYTIDSLPFTYGIILGAKYITYGGYYFSPFFKYQSYQQSFNQSGGNINYGTLNPIVNQYQFGINFGMVM